MGFQLLKALDKNQTAELIEAFQNTIVERLLGEEAYLQFSLGKISKKILSPYAEEIQRVSEMYTIKAKPNKAVINKISAEAYTLYYAPVNFAKILHLMNKLPSDIFTSETLRILDFGSGPATASFAVDAFTSQSVIADCVDYSKDMLEIINKISSGISPSKSRFNCRVSFEEGQPDLYDMIILPNVLSEISMTSREPLMESLLASLKDKGILLILEPALQRITREAMQERDRLLSKYRSLVPIFPCTRRDACPMLKSSETDWCHGILEWQEPRLVKQFDELTGFNKHRIKYSAFIFQKSGAMKNGYRVVSVPEKAKHGWNAVLCGENVYQKFTLPKRERSEKNRHFEKIRLHDLLNLPEVPKDYAITKDISCVLVEGKA